MTALVLAGTGGGGVEPDLVLPPGFDRVGEVRRFEQDSGPAASASPAPPVAIHLAPAEGATEPAPFRVRQRCARCEAIGHNARTCTALIADELGVPDDNDETDCKSVRSLKRADLVPCTRCGLRGHVAGDPDRCLYYRGSFGLGGAAAAAMGEAQWRNPTAGRGDQ